MMTWISGLTGLSNPPERNGRDMTLMNMFSKKILALMALAMLVLPLSMTAGAGKAFAQSMIMPLRVTFQPRDRMQEITLYNPSNTSAVTYKLLLLNRAMTEDGNYQAIDGLLNPEFDPETALVFSPRQVTLPAGGKQKIRISLRRPADLPDGEYRAHLNLQRVGQTNSRAPVDDESVNMQIGMNFGIAIPVVVRQGGPYDTTATIGKPTLKPASADGSRPAMIEFDIQRNGKYSANGHVNVYWTPAGGKEQLIATRNAVKIYHEINKLKMSIALDKGVTTMAGGSLRITFDGYDLDEGIKFDEKVFPLGG